MEDYRYIQVKELEDEAKDKKEFEEFKRNREVERNSSEIRNELSL